MDGKGERRLKEKLSVRRRKGTESYAQLASKFFKQHKRSLLTGILLITMGALLIGIFAQLPAPASSTPPNGATVVSYSAFVEQVKADNVLAATFQGQAIHILLAKPQQATATTSPRSSASQAADVTTWSRYAGAGYPSWPNTSLPPPH